MPSYFGVEVSITELEHIPGMSDGRVVNRLYDLAKGKDVIVEVGSWKGRTAIKMARSCNGIVYCVDTWLGSGDHNETSEADTDPLSVYRSFLAHVAHFGVAHKIAPIAQSSHTANALFKNIARSVDMLFIDGDHWIEAIMLDLLRWVPLVRYGGIVCGDDYKAPSVEVAVQAYAKRFDYSVRTEIDDKMWFLEK